MSADNLSSTLRPALGMKLWRPGTISLMAVVLGFPSGIILASINWIRMGLKGKAFIHLIGGMILLWAMVSFSDRILTALLVLTNIGMAFYLNAAMRKDMQEVDPAGIQYSHWISAIAISLVSLAIIWVVIYSFSFLEGLFPGTSLYHTNRGDAYSNQGNYELAVTEYTRAIELGTNRDRQAIQYYYRGLAFYNKGDMQNAITDFSRVIERKPAEGRAFLMRGVAYSSNADYESAVADLTRAIQINPEDSIAYYDRGFAYENKGDFKNAISDFSRVIQKDPNDGEAYLHRGLSYKSLGATDQAIHDFEKVVELATDLNLKAEAEKELLKLKGSGLQ